MFLFQKFNLNNNSERRNETELVSEFIHIKRELANIERDQQHRGLLYTDEDYNLAEIDELIASCANKISEISYSQPSQKGELLDEIEDIIHELKIRKDRISFTQDEFEYFWF